MLNEIYKEALAVMSQRSQSSTVYCGWGTTIDDMVNDYCLMGGSWRLVRKVLNLAYYG